MLTTSCAPSLESNPPRDASKAVPNTFAGAQVSSAAASGAPNAAQKTWNEFFDDPDLQSLIAAALKNNQELNIRLQEIMIAKAEVLGRTGEYLPHVDAQVGAGIERVGEHTRFGVLDSKNGVPQHLQGYGFGFRASWEVDIWKKLRNAAKAANLRYLATVEGRNFMITQLVAEVAASYYELMALDNQLDVLKSNIEIQQHALEMVKFQKEAARATELAVQRFEAEVLKNQSRQYKLEQERIEAENRINFLLARPPQPVKRNSEKFNQPLPEVVGAGIPSELLDNRPDVRAAELELEASKLDVKSAKASFYPSLKLDAGVGYESFNIKHLVATPASIAYNIAGNLVAPLLNRRGIKAQYYAANAQQLQAVFHYEQTVLKAFTEVVNTLARADNLKKGYDLQSQQVDKLVQSIEISTILFQSARADYMEVLLTRRDSLEAQMELIETKNRQLQAIVSIYQSLGGGWKL
ncbi:MAG: TolC family protein [Myxococcales bacterium]